ncbi:MAG: transcriptional regulator CynR [Chloroflexi bacterium CFX4]|nr:transcriptional regulator CynR [Chloroflexi bacterium CFX4]MDL1922638.1 transcriptional regulator CynR [Chloroflexi bacterium CFX3]
MDLRKLRYLLTVAEEKHFTRAAERLYISQPSLSQQIKHLEDELGTALIERSSRLVRLTAAGELLCQHARHIFNELQDAQTALAELAHLERGTLAIGCVQTVNAYLMPRLLSAFVAQHPNIALSVEEMPAAEIEARLLEGTLQIGLGFSPPSQPAIEAEVLFDEELVLYVAADHPLAGCTQLELRQLEGVPLALLPRTFCTRRIWEACAQQAALTPKVMVELNTVQGLLSLVSHSRLASVLPQLAQSLAQNLCAIRLVLPTPRRSIALLWRRNAFKCAASRAFAHLLKSTPLGIG